MLIAGFLVVFAGVFAIGNGNRCGNKTDVELYDPNDPSKFHCWPFPDCHDGQEPSVEPGSTHLTGTDVHCKPCREGESFSNRETNYRCRTCTTCGNKVVLLTCTISRDRLCDKRCISTEFYLNTTDGKCYPCTECCGVNKANLETQCLSSKTVHIGMEIGEKGALHCKVLSSQQCDELLKNNTQDKMYNESKGNVSSTSNNPATCNENTSKRKDTCSESTLDTLHIVLICFLAFFVTCICMVLLWLYIRERKMQSPRNEMCLWFDSCYPSSAGQGCRGVCEPLIISFQERVKFIPEEVRINSIPYEVEEFIKKLDAKQPWMKNWYDVGRKLGVSNDDLNLIKREDDRQGGTPTTPLISALCTQENVISLRKFVQVLHDLKRNDIAIPIIEFYRQAANTNDTTV